MANTYELWIDDSSGTVIRGDISELRQSDERVTVVRKNAQGETETTVVPWTSVIRLVETAGPQA